MLDGDRNRNIRDAVSLGPLQCRRSGGVFLLAVPDFFEDSVWNQDSGDETLDYVETADAGKENEW